jgi:hypothetical protein
MFSNNAGYMINEGLHLPSGTVQSGSERILNESRRKGLANITRLKP